MIGALLYCGWQVWEQQCVVIVMTTRTVERHRTKCGQYWPELEGEWCTFLFAIRVIKTVNQLHSKGIK